MSNTVDRPATWSRRANAPYYRERYALEVKHVLDEMILAAESGDREPRILKYTDYPEISHVTLYLKINQAMMYLLDKLDTDEKTYFNFRQLINISRLRSIGIKIGFAHGVDNKSLAAYKVSSTDIPQEKPKEVKLPESKPLVQTDWKEQLANFVEIAQVGQSLKLTGLQLTMVDGEYIRDHIPDDKCIIYEAKTDSLMCIKLTPEEYAKTK